MSDSLKFLRKIEYKRDKERAFIFDRMVKKVLSERRGRRNNKCKDPKGIACVASLRNNKEASLVEALEMSYHLSPVALPLPPRLFFFLYLIFLLLS